jgi:Tfp pilus assembly protein PilO
MTTRDKAILVGLPIVALALAFWFLILAPKREEASTLGDEVAALESEVAEHEQIANAAEQSRLSFPRNYRRLVVLGKAVPEDSDTSSLLVQLTRAAAQTGVDFRRIELVDSDASAPTAPPPEPPAETAPEAPPETAESSGQEVAATEAGALPELATEAAAANLPIGATVGPAGLAVMPYKLTFEGDFFAIADFVSRLDKLVGLRRNGRPTVFGRLMTIDGFQLTVPESSAGTESGSSGATLQANFTVTTYVAPEDEGATAGAAPTGPAPAEPQPVAAPTTPEPAAAPPVAAASAGGTP